MQSLAQPSEQRRVRDYATWLNHPASWFAAVLFLGTLAFTIVITPHDIPPWVSTVGFHLTVFGLICTVLGFTVTLYQLRETKTAFTAAKEAVDKARSERRYQDALGQVRMSIAQSSQALSSLSDPNWKHFKLSYEQLRISLILALSSDYQFKPEEISVIESAKDHATSVCSQLDSELKDENVNLIIIELSSKVRQLQENLLKLESSMKARYNV